MSAAAAVLSDSSVVAAFNKAQTDIRAAIAVVRAYFDDSGPGQDLLLLIKFAWITTTAGSKLTDATRS